MQLGVVYWFSGPAAKYIFSQIKSSYSTACPWENTSSTHLPSLTHQPQYGSLAWVHFSQSEYLWQSCTGSRYTWRTKSKANRKGSQEGTRRCSWTGLYNAIDRGSRKVQSDFKKIQTKPECDCPHLTESKSTHFSCSFSLQYSLMPL